MSDLTLVIVVPNRELAPSLKHSLGLFKTNISFGYLPVIRPFAMNQTPPSEVYNKILFITGDDRTKVFPDKLSFYDLERITTRITLKNELMNDLDLVNSFLLFNLPYLIQTKYYLTLNFYFDDNYQLGMDTDTLKNIKHDYLSGRLKNSLDACHNGYNTNPFISVKSKTLGMFLSTFSSNLLSTGLPLQSFYPIDTFITSTIIDDLLSKGFKIDSEGFCNPLGGGALVIKP